LPDAPQSSRDLLRPEDIAATERERPGIDWQQSRNWVRRSTSTAGTEDEQRQRFLDMIRPPARGLNRLADLMLARHALQASDLAIYGFSQGGMMALYQGFERESPCAGIVSHSGHYVGAVEVRSRPPVFLIYGAVELEPPRRMAEGYAMTVSNLREADVAFDEHVVPGLAHGVNDEVAVRVGAFLSSVLSGGGDASSTRSEQN
jgi:predicted esterase